MTKPEKLKWRPDFNDEGVGEPMQLNDALIWLRNRIREHAAELNRVIGGE